MQLLTPDDLLSIDEYEPRRQEFFEAHRRYCDQYRRIRVGPSAIIHFENRQTLWFKAQEMLRVTRLREPEWIQRVLASFNELLPGANRLQAALILDDSDDAAWTKFKDDSIQLVLGSLRVSPRITSSQPSDRALGTAHWLEFPIYRSERKLLADFSTPAFLDINCGKYRHTSGRLSEEIRQSLIDDLDLSDRDAA